MEYIHTNKFEISDMPGMNTLAFLVEEDSSANIPFYSLQKIEHVDVQVEGRVNKQFNVLDEGKEQDIVLLTLANKKAILSTGILDKNGLKSGEGNKSVNYSSIFNADGIEYKVFAYTPNMKRRFTIIDTVTCEEVKPMLYVDELTKEVKGRCKLLPLRPYIVLEIGNFKARMVGMTSELDGKKLDYTEGAEISVEGISKNANEKTIDDREPDGAIV